jgi:hypothetical protein
MFLSLFPLFAKQLTGKYQLLNPNHQWHGISDICWLNYRCVKEKQMTIQYTGHLLESAEFWALCSIWKISEHGEAHHVLVINIISISVVGWVMNDNMSELCVISCVCKSSCSRIVDRLYIEETAISHCNILCYVI